MRLRRFVPVLALAVALGFVVARLEGSSRFVSVQVWLTVSFVFAGILVLLRLPRERTIAWDRRSWRSEAPAPDRPAPAELRSLRGLIAAANDRDRVYQRRLRPRLQAIADDQQRSGGQAIPVPHEQISLDDLTAITTALEQR